MLAKSWGIACAEQMNNQKWFNPNRRFWLNSIRRLHKLDGVNPASFQPVVVVAARLLASPILQEYDAFTVDELTGIPPQSNLWKW